MTAPEVHIQEVSCIQYEPEADRSKDEAERIAILKVRRALTKRGYFSGIFQYALSHRNSGHIHLVICTEDNDEGFMCECCKEVQKGIRTHKGKRSFKTCNCGDCISCDPIIRQDMEQKTRS